MEPLAAVALAGAVAEAAVATRGVARLDGGLAGTVATYGGGTRVRGVRLTDGENPSVDVHVVLVIDYGRPIPTVTAEVRTAVAAALDRAGDHGRAVNIHVADVTTEPEVAGELPPVAEEL